MGFLIGLFVIAKIGAFIGGAIAFTLITFGLFVRCGVELLINGTKAIFKFLSEHETGKSMKQQLHDVGIHDDWR